MLFRGNRGKLNKMFLFGPMRAPTPDYTSFIYPSHQSFFRHDILQFAFWTGTMQQEIVQSLYLARWRSLCLCLQHIYTLLQKALLTSLSLSSTCMTPLIYPEIFFFLFISTFVSVTCLKRHQNTSCCVSHLGLLTLSGFYSRGCPEKLWRKSGGSHLDICVFT